MHQPVVALRRAVMSLAAIFIASVPLGGQSQGTIDCSPGGHGAGCEVKLEAGQSSALIRFRPTILGPTTFTIRGGGLNEKVSLNGDMTANFRWIEAAPPTDTVLILVETAGAPIVQWDTVRIYPHVAAARTLALQDNLAPYVWIRNQWLPLTLRIGVGTAQGAQLTQAECEKVRFALQPLPDGDASPDTGRASYYPNRSGYTCFVEPRWKFAEVTGRQDLGIRVGDESVRIPGVAREGPRIAAGIAWFSRHTSKDTRYCNSYSDDFDVCSEDRVSFSDSVKKTRMETHDKEWQPFFAVETPPFLGWDQSTNPIGQYLQTNVRVVAGSTFVEPQKNFFVGLTLLPLRATELESLPLQLQAAWRWNGGFVGGLSVDGSGLISNALKALGAPF
ncbi:hypothetical protein [Longimicrobium terrae]|uniref:Uncharacterized protein n=1 Tax=Longimicrobium terrae TaxID=1639882 RepID=A0A841GK44_9BACT|nr:hypothetical protein [Longimicrobium terrae]MBB4634019.1 hypothetical protein [Longimicrobium terrae]MBB6069091.1 hypothetical protein [Longimicrobium terrae]NNC28265.1 hypothetical protein [Longimicrobium terrae]